MPENSQNPKDASKDSKSSTKTKVEPRSERSSSRGSKNPKGSDFKRSSSRSGDSQRSDSRDSRRDSGGSDFKRSSSRSGDSQRSDSRDSGGSDFKRSSSRSGDSQRSDSGGFKDSRDSRRDSGGSDFKRSSSRSGDSQRSDSRGFKDSRDSRRDSGGSDFKRSSSRSGDSQRSDSGGFKDSRDSRRDSGGSDFKRSSSRSGDSQRSDSRGFKDSRDSRRDPGGSDFKRSSSRSGDSQRSDSRGFKDSRDSRRDSGGSDFKRSSSRSGDSQRSDSRGFKDSRDSRRDSGGSDFKRSSSRSGDSQRSDSRGFKDSRDSRRDSDGSDFKRSSSRSGDSQRSDSRGFKDSRDSRRDSGGSDFKRSSSRSGDSQRSDSRGFKDSRDSRRDSGGSDFKRSSSRSGDSQRSDSRGGDSRRSNSHPSGPRSRFNQPRYNTRAVAAEVLTQILYRNRLSEDALNSGFARVPKEDIKLLHALCYGVLRWHGVLEAQALHLIGKQQADLHPQVQLILEVGIWQLAQGHAEHAAIHQCVEACEQVGLMRAKNFVNAILRKAQSAINDDNWKLENYSYEFPEPLRAMLIAEDFSQDPSLRLGAYTGKLIEEFKPVAEKINQRLIALQTVQPIISLRVQTNRISVETYREQLEKLNIQSEVGCYDNSLIIRQPIQVEKLPGYAVGAIVVQDMAAQCAAHILNPQAKMSVLDACSAPGGKASHLQQLANNELELIALEIDDYRSRKLRENFGRTRTNGKVIIGSATSPSEWWHGRAFDKILADVSCSGTGVMRRHPDIPWLRKKEDILAHSSEGLKIISRLWSLLKEKGQLLYVTCSVLPEENDFLIEQFLRYNSNAIKVDFDLPLEHVETIHGKQVLPQADSDSLYYCLLGKEKPAL